MGTGNDRWQMAVEITVEAVNNALFDIEEAQRGAAHATVRVPVLLAHTLCAHAAHAAAWDTAAFTTLAADVQSIISQTVAGSPLRRVMSAVAGALEATRAQRDSAGD